jgi:Asp-tRNA(Asn)/Glu-tRNA(Gln) amidotransferase A subunit family amidase
VNCAAARDRPAGTALGAFTVIGAQVARAAAEDSTKRWRAGAPLSAIDGMPVGVKDMIATVEAATTEVQQITMGINAWERRWPLGSFMARDASALSPSAMERHARSQAMTQAEYATLLARRELTRAAYLALGGEVDAVISVTAPGAAPVGVETTGNPVFAVPGSMLEAPGVSLPVLNDNGLPLGLQVLGFPQDDAALFAVAGWIENALRREVLRVFVSLHLPEVNNSWTVLPNCATEGWADELTTRRR